MLRAPSSEEGRTTRWCQTHPQYSAGSPTAERPNTSTMLSFTTLSKNDCFAKTTENWKVSFHSPSCLSFLCWYHIKKMRHMSKSTSAAQISKSPSLWSYHNPNPPRTETNPRRTVDGIVRRGIRLKSISLRLIWANWASGWRVRGGRMRCNIFMFLGRILLDLDRCRKIVMRISVPSGTGWKGDGENRGDCDTRFIFLFGTGYCRYDISLRLGREQTFLLRPWLAVLALLLMGYG